MSIIDYLSEIRIAYYGWRLAHTKGEQAHVIWQKMRRAISQRRASQVARMERQRRLL